MRQKILFLKNIFTVLLFIFFGISIFTAVTSKSAKLFSIRSYVVLSGSMEPEIPTGSVVYTRPASHYSIGDVISFTNQSGQTVTHRIIADGKTFFKVAGDANSSPDANPVPANRVLGRVVFHLPHLGFLAAYLRTPLGFILLIVLPALTFIGSELWRIKTEIEKATEKRILSRLNLTQT